MLDSKLAIPRHPLPVLPRPRLYDKLTAGVEDPLTLVAAQAGAGKTVLLGTWAASRPVSGPLAWLSLDPADNNSSRFWTYILASLSRSGALADMGNVQRLLPRQGDDQSFLPLLVDVVAQAGERVVLVLDDFHEITNPALLKGIEFLFSHAASVLRLVLGSRVDPPLPLHRMRVSGALTEVRAADLAFTATEADELLEKLVPSCNLTTDDRALLHARTEGWAAGLRLAALSLQRLPDPHRFVQDFAGSDRSVADYLLAEVLDRQPEDLRRFLIRTCIVDELSGDLADALTGRDDGERTLKELERANLFVTAVEPRRDSYRYHPLFAELLRLELRHETPEEIRELRRRAAGWYHARGLTIEAIAQAVSGADSRLIGDVIVERGMRLTLRGHAGLFHDLLGRVPAEMVATDAELALLSSCDSLLHAGGTEVGAALLLAREQERQVSPERRPMFSLLLAMCRMIRARQAGAADEVAAIAREVLSVHGSDTPVGSVEQEAVAVTLSYMGGAELSAGNLDAAEAHLLRAQALTVRAGLEPHRLECLSQLALLHALRGQLNDADRLGRVAVQFAESLGWSATALATGGHLALAWVHYERDELAFADGCLAQASSASLESPGNPLAVFVKVLQARLLHAQGDLVGAFQSLDVGAAPDIGTESSELRSHWLVATEADIRTAIGDLTTAHDLLDGGEGGAASGAAGIVRRARLAVAVGDPDDAIAALALVRGGGVPSMAADVLLEAWLVESLARDALGDSDTAVACLQRAVDLAEPEDARRAFLDAAPALRAILSRQDQRITSSWSLLDDLGGDPITAHRASAWGLPVMIEPLTERERGVLRYLPSMLSYGEIAAELYISPHTIKSHARNIYRKLGSSSRRDAVERARGLKLLRS